MKSILLLSALASISVAQAPFYPKASGQGEATSANKDIARFSLNCTKTDGNYQAPIKGGIKVIVTTSRGLVRTFNLPEAQDADFQIARCTLSGPGFLLVDYGKGKVSKYSGIIRATIFDRTSDSKNQQDAISVSFQAKDLKTPQAMFEGAVTKGKILVTHLPIHREKPPIKKLKGNDGSG